MGEYATIRNMNGKTIVDFHHLVWGGIQGLTITEVDGMSIYENSCNGRTLHIKGKKFNIDFNQICSSNEIDKEDIHPDFIRTREKGIFNKREVLTSGWHVLKTYVDIEISTNNFEIIGEHGDIPTT